MPLAAAQAEYAEWFEAASADDKRSGALRWKAQDRSNRYDYRVVRERLDELHEVRQTGDLKRLMYYFDEGMHGNMAGIGAPGLYRRAKTGTKSLIEEYVREIDDGLQHLATVDSKALSVEERLNFFRRARQAFGRCGLMLSGAGSLGPFHLGVAQALASQNLIPTVISGASAGSMVAAVLCAHEDGVVLERLTDGSILDTLEDAQGLEPSTDGRRMGADAVRLLIESWIPDLTFAEAREVSGRSLNVSVAPSTMHQQSRTLNDVTSPNVMIREAVLASCAVPGVFPPVQLMAKNAVGKRTPYVKSRRWVDGSVTSDMPRRQLARVHGCNFFIASQTNPVVRWAIGQPNSSNPIFQALSLYQAAAKEVVRATYPLAMRVTRHAPSLGVAARMWYSVVTQDYTADVNILPKQRFWDPSKLLSPLTPERALELIDSGRHATWPEIERIRYCTAVTRRVDLSIKQLTAATGSRSKSRA